MDDHQIYLPPSFTALYADGPRQRLRIDKQALLQRYEWCEDLAQMLHERSRGLMLQWGITEEDVLPRVAQGLHDPACDLNEAEAGWVQTRLAELLGLPLNNA